VNLAKAELAEALVIMTRRLPNIRRVDLSPWKPVIGVSGPTTLPVEFDPKPGHEFEARASVPFGSKRRA
jgi:cytochrome P450